jgi:hypothetical protein
MDLWDEDSSRAWTVAMEATIFTGWIYDHLLPHAAAVRVAHPLMLRAIALAKKKNDRIDAGKMPTACAVISCRSARWLPLQFGNGAAPCATAICWCARWCNEEPGLGVAAGNRCEPQQTAISQRWAISGSFLPPMRG